MYSIYVYKTTKKRIPLKVISHYLGMYSIYYSKKFLALSSIWLFPIILGCIQYTLSSRLLIISGLQRCFAWPNNTGCSIILLFSKKDWQTAILYDAWQNKPQLPDLYCSILTTSSTKVFSRADTLISPSLLLSFSTASIPFFFFIIFFSLYVKLSD